MKPKQIAHLGIAVHDLEAALTVYRDALGMTHEDTVEMADRGLKIAFLRVGEVQIELLQPLHDQSEISRFLDKRGEGIHHLCLEVDDIQQSLSEVDAAGVRVISPKPSIGAEGLPVSFLHPKSCHGVLLELLESEGGPASR